MNCDVIVTYCWNRVGYNILRSLAAHGLSVWVADTSPKNICSISKYCAGSFTYPDPFVAEEAFINCLLQKVDELKPKILLPTHDESVVIMRHRDKFPESLIIPYESEEILLTLANKAKATELAIAAGVPAPKVYGSVVFNFIGYFLFPFRKLSCFKFPFIELSRFFTPQVSS